MTEEIKQLEESITAWQIHLEGVEMRLKDLREKLCKARSEQFLKEHFSERQTANS